MAIQSGSKLVEASDKGAFCLHAYIIYAEDIMREVLEEEQGGISIGGVKKSEQEKDQDHGN